MIDYYELLQISPKADAETIHRVYKYLAARLHPDNPRSGDAAKFRLVKTAYDALSHPLRRAEYDTRYKATVAPLPPLSSTIDFMDQFEGETNRRMAVLSVLYYQRRMTPNSPDVSLAEIEERMGFPRDYLDFTLWYLVKKKYVDRTDAITYSLTAEGVDFIERERTSVPQLSGLLTRGSSAENTPIEEEIAAQKAQPGSASEPMAHGPKPIVLPSSMKDPTDRRTGKKGRRMGEPDLRIIKVERRKSTRDRRATRGQAS